MGSLSASNVLDLVLGGLAIGCVYSLVALGFAMIMRATSIIHFAQGEVMMLGSMCGLTALWLLPGLPLVLVLLVGMISAGAIAVAMELSVYRTLRRRRVPIMNVITATVGMSILCINAARLVWGSEPLRFPELFAVRAYSFAGVRVSPQLFWIMVMGLVIMLALRLFLKHTPRPSTRSTSSSRRSSGRGVPTARRYATRSARRTSRACADRSSSTRGATRPS